MFEASAVDLLKFLTMLYDRNLSYSSINLARSAISSVQSLVSGSQLGTHPLITRFVKGVFNNRPAVPRYSQTWDPDVVLSCLDVNLSAGTLLQKSRKLVVLLLLLSGQRLATVSKIRLADIEFISDGRVNIFITSLCKQSRPGFHQAPLVFSSFDARPNLCMVTLLKSFIADTRELRNESCDNLFLTSTLPYRNAKQDTIANWVRFVLKEAGLGSLFWCTQYSECVCF